MSGVVGDKLMVQFLVNGRAIVAAEIYDTVKKAIGLIPASYWMFTANDELGGKHPIGALRDGDEQKVRAAAVRLIALAKAKAA